MNIYYAIGGGLGHLTRARVFLQQMNIERETAILTSSEFADDQRVVGNIQIIKVDPALSRDKSRFLVLLKDSFDQYNCQKIYLDAFPFGISGEFANFDFGQIELFYVARLLKSGCVQKFDPNDSPRFSKTFLLETLPVEHLEFIEEVSSSTEVLDLKYEKHLQTQQSMVEKIVERHSPFWLIVHSGNEIETLELLDYAKEIRNAEGSKHELVTISPLIFESENRYDIYPAYELFPFAEKVFTACGFNSMKQTESFREKHLFLPFDRRYDDQFLRAKFARERVLKSP
jgi:predicted glycosyltransferase